MQNFFGSIFGLAAPPVDAVAKLFSHGLFHRRESGRDVILKNFDAKARIDLDGLRGMLSSLLRPSGRADKSSADDLAAERLMIEELERRAKETEAATKDLEAERHEAERREAERREAERREAERREAERGAGGARIRRETRARAKG